MIHVSTNHLIPFPIDGPIKQSRTTLLLLLLYLLGSVTYALVDYDLVLLSCFQLWARFPSIASRGPYARVTRFFQFVQLRDEFVSSFPGLARQLWDILIVFADKYEYDRCTGSAAWVDSVSPLLNPDVNKLLVAQRGNSYPLTLRRRLLCADPTVFLNLCFDSPTVGWIQTWQPSRLWRITRPSHLRAVKVT